MTKAGKAAKQPKLQLDAAQVETLFVNLSGGRSLVGITGLSHALTQLQLGDDWEESDIQDMLMLFSGSGSAKLSREEFMALLSGLGVVAR